MPTDALDTYQELFKTASEELHLAEKQAGILTRGAEAASEVAGKARSWLNNTGPAQKINNSRAGKLFQSYGNDMFGVTDPGRVNRQVDGVTDSVRRQIDDLENQRMHDDFDERLFEGMSDQEKQWTRAQGQRDAAGQSTHPRDVRYTDALEEHTDKVRNKAKEWKARAEDAEELADSRVGKWTAAGIGAGTLGTGLAAGYGYGNYKGQQRGRNQRNMAFGAGLAAGASGPQVIQGMSRQRAYRQPPQGSRYGY